MREASPIRNYTDYRTYLRDVYAERKGAQSHFSFQSWANALGVRSSATLFMILRGHRHPGTELSANLVKNLELSTADASYFLDLIALEKSRSRGDARVGSILIEKLGASTKADRFQSVDPDTFEMISHWYFYALRELVTLKGFVEDTFWMVSRMRYRLGSREINRALRTMLRLGMLKRNAAGKLQPSEAILETPPDVAAEGFKRFHEEMLDNAKTALRTVALPKREFIGTSLAISEKNLPKAKDLIRRFNQEFCDLLEAKAGDAVYHLELSFFPLTRSVEEKE